MIGRRAWLAASGMVVAQSGSALSRSYLVFFEARKTSLSPRAHTIIAEWVDMGRRMMDGEPIFNGTFPSQPVEGPIFMQVFGQASDGSNEEDCFRLASERASAVGRMALQLGAERDRLRCWSGGQHTPLVPEAPPSEPQNRLVRMEFARSLGRPISVWPWLSEPTAHLLRPVLLQ